MIARYQDGAVGRFISPDPTEGKIDNPQSLNKYTYARNNPVILIDPDGKNIAQALTGLVVGVAKDGYNAVAKVISKVPEAIIHPIEIVKASINEKVDFVKEGAQQWKNLITDLKNNFSNTTWRDKRSGRKRI